MKFMGLEGTDKEEESTVYRSPEGELGNSGRLPGEERDKGGYGDEWGGLVGAEMREIVSRCRG